VVAELAKKIETAASNTPWGSVDSCCGLTLVFLDPHMLVSAVPFMGLLCTSSSPYVHVCIGRESQFWGKLNQLIHMWYTTFGVPCLYSYCMPYITFSALENYRMQTRQW
jgi:hypothetical protein